jgi:thiamine kinase-like enzyme
VLQTIAPNDYVEFTAQICSALSGWGLLEKDQVGQLNSLANSLTQRLAQESISLVHGDFYAENLILRGEEIHIIDWSWFAILGVPLMDLATVTMDHFKNGELYQYRQQIIEAYCFESGRSQKEIEKLLPATETLSRLLFLHWLVVRRQLGIMGTTVGHVDNLIAEVLGELQARHNSI